MECLLSAEEFSRLQTQLLELREVNYRLDDQCKSQHKEILNLRGQVNTLNGDLQKASKALKTNRKPLHVDADLIRENESLKQMLMRQDEEYRLQNETMLNEVSQLLTANKDLENRLEASQKHNVTVVAHLHDEVRHLQAENSALQKALASGNRVVAEPFTVLNENSPTSVSTTTLDNTEYSPAADLQLKLQTEKEEKQMLSQHMRELEEFNRQEADALRGEIARLSEKLRKKQDSFLQFQKEQDLLVKELTLKLDEQQQLRATNQEELDVVRHSYRRLLDEMSTLHKVSTENETWLKSRCVELESTVVGLQRQVETLKAEHSSSLTGMQQMQQKAEELMGEVDDLRAQLREYQSAQMTGAEQLMSAEAKCAEHLTALSDIETVANKRQCLLDEVMVKHQREADEYARQIRDITEQHENQLRESAALQNQLKTKSAELETAQSELQDVQSKVRVLESAKDWLEMELSEIQECLRTTKEHCDTSVEECHRDCKQKITQFELQQISTIEKLRETCSQQEKEISELKAAVMRLEQEIKDHADDRKIHEMKGAAMIKDLKKQVQSERHRADNLQERLQRFLSESPQALQAVEELFHPPDVNKRHKTGEDGSSVSSWSLVGGAVTGGGGGSRDGSCISQTPEEDGWMVLRQENNELLRRMTELQQQAWTLEEKVVQLESTNASMVDDLLNKTAIIEHYMMDSKPDQASFSSATQEKNKLRRMLDFVKDNGDENLRDINRKLQRILEETLIKNMQLQKDVEKLSEERVPNR
jgi:chromosome segregation ATPase